MSSGEVTLPYAKIQKKKLIMTFSAFDMDLPVIAAGLRERMDVLREMGVAFAGFGTDVPADMNEQTPAMVRCFFEFVGKDGDPVVILKRAYHLIWTGIVQNFPDMLTWASAKADLSSLTLAQAEIIRARRGEQ